MKYAERFVIYKQTRERAEKILLPDELWETDAALKELEARSKASQADLDKMMATQDESIRAVLLRTIAALENATEAMDRMTATLNVRIAQSTK